MTENIPRGVPPDELDHDHVRHGARIARIDTFVKDHLHNGYDTHIGERGVRVSGGNRQRLGIARVLDHGAGLIGFNEAPSVLDNLIGREVMEARSVAGRQDDPVDQASVEHRDAL